MRFLLILSILSTLSFAEFIKSENIVIDKKQNLMWQDNIEATYTEEISMGNVYCDELVLNGYIDWRLPSIKELQSLIDQTGKSNYLEKTFQFFENGKYWSTTPNVLKNRNYWYIDFKRGKVANEEKTTLNHIRCVRDLK